MSLTESPGDAMSSSRLFSDPQKEKCPDGLRPGSASWRPQENEVEEEKGAAPGQLSSFLYLCLIQDTFGCFLSHCIVFNRHLLIHICVSSVVLLQTVLQ